MAKTQLLRRLLPGSPGLFPQSCTGIPIGLQKQPFYASISNDKENEQQSCSVGQASPSPSLVQLANTINRPAPLSLYSPVASFAASPVLGLPARRRAGALGGLQRPAFRLPQADSHGLARTYYTEGEIFGTTYMYTTTMMFWAGLVGAVAFRRNLIVLLLSAETVMLACNMNFLFASAYLNDITGAIMSITITTIAACETAIGLALCVAYFHMRSATDVEALNLLK